MKIRTLSLLLLLASCASSVAPTDGAGGAPAIAAPSGSGPAADPERLFADEAWLADDAGLNVDSVTALQPERWVA